MRDKFKPERKEETLPLTDIKPVIFLYKGTPYRVTHSLTIDGETFVKGEDLTALESSKLVSIIAPKEVDEKAKGCALKSYDKPRSAWRNVFYICSACYKAGDFSFAVMDRAIDANDPNTYVCMECDKDF